MTAVFAFIFFFCVWLSILEMRLRRMKTKNRINKVSSERNWKAILELKKDYGKEKSSKKGQVRGDF